MYPIVGPLSELPLKTIPYATLIGSVVLSTLILTVAERSPPATLVQSGLLAAEPLTIPSGQDAVLQARLDAVLARMAAKRVAVDRLLAGRIDVAEAARLFLAANQSSAEAIHHLNLHWPGMTDEERALRQVILYLENERRFDPRITPERLERVRREFAGTPRDY